ncbi:HAD family hydrolase [Haloarchaeobius sp. TZWWS8]|uniref:HAD family hydrolase n=1 Tax=Haloarchaeobius sp. TZWWS8 TaxID=3446121 RepID=UPI003EBAB46B
MASPATVLFDLDLTLCVSEQDRDALLSQTFDEVGIEQFCDPADLGAVVPTLPTAQTELEFYENVFTAAAQQLDAGEVPARALAHAHADLVDHSAVRFREGAEEALAAAREHADRVGLVTNGGKESQTTKMESLGIADAFDAAVFVDPRNGIDPKPAAAPFERALDALDADPSETVHVGDSLHSDVAGANAMGIDSVWVPYDEASELGDHEPTYRLDSVGELATVL